VLRRPTHLFVALTLVAVLAAACGQGVQETAPTTAPSVTEPVDPTTSTTRDSGEFEPEPIEFEECGEGFECGTVEVPLDYDDPAGDTIEVAVLRSPAQDPDERIGVLLTNPGGPGASGLDYVAARPFPQEVLDRFDLIGWDPRGVGDTEPIGCGDTVPEFLAQDPSPDDEAERTALDGAAEAVADECAEEDGEILPHVGTADVVQDMDMIRRALGEDQISYAGYSYGTNLGLYYLDRFPENARAVVLDGVVDPSHDLTTFLSEQGVAIEGVLDEMLAACATDDRCPLDDAAASWDRVAAAVEEEPLPAEGPDVGPARLQVAGVYVTYQFSPDDRVALWEALVDAEAGDGQGLSDLASQYEDLGGFATYVAIECADLSPPGPQEYEQFAADLIAEAPRVGAGVANELLPCAFWPAESTLDPRPIVAAGSPPVLVVGTTGDNATPYEQAVEVAETLADGHLLTFDGPGHVASGRSECIDDAETRYLVDLDVPPDGTVC
jgi:pimeloyl-ACP methyl ester carboxylesterase